MNQSVFAQSRSRLCLIVSVSRLMPHSIDSTSLIIPVEKSKYIRRETFASYNRPSRMRGQVLREKN